MWNKFINSKLVERWSAVFSIIFSPGFFLGAMITGFSLFLSIYYKENIPFSNMMAIIGSIFGGITGAFFKEGYDHVTNKNILEKKGRSALRNLQGIRTQLRNIEVWVSLFKKRTRKKEDKKTFEEICRHITTIDLNISSGLEDWVDIIPELKERSQKEAAIERKYKEVVQSVMVELLEKRKELSVIRDKKVGKELKKKIGDLEKQVKEIKKDRMKVSDSVDWSGGLVNEPITLSSSVKLANDHLFTAGQYKCIRCGKSFYPNISLADTASAWDNTHNYCDECKEIMEKGLN